MKKHSSYYQIDLVVIGVKTGNTESDVSAQYCARAKPCETATN